MKKITSVFLFLAFILLSGITVDAQTTNKSSNSKKSSNNININDFLIRDSGNVYINTDLISHLLKMGFSIQDPMISDDKILFFDENEKLMVMEDGYYDESGNWVLVRNYSPEDFIHLKKNNINIYLFLNNDGNANLTEVYIIFPTSQQRREFINEALTWGFISCYDYFVISQINSLYLEPLYNKTLTLKNEQPVVLNGFNMNNYRNLVWIGTFCALKYDGWGDILQTKPTQEIQDELTSLGFNKTGQRQTTFNATYGYDEIIRYRAIEYQYTNGGTTVKILTVANKNYVAQNNFSPFKIEIIYDNQELFNSFINNALKNGFTKNKTYLVYNYLSAISVTFKGTTITIEFYGGPDSYDSLEF